MKAAGVQAALFLVSNSDRVASHQDCTRPASICAEHFGKKGCEEGGRSPHSHAINARSLWSGDSGSHQLVRAALEEEESTDAEIRTRGDAGDTIKIRSRRGGYRQRRVFAQAVEN
jgi:hypothetical protein